MNPDVTNGISAQVVLRSTSTVISKGISDYFLSQGFKTHAQVANSFTIEGTRELFESYFAVKLETGSNGEVHIAGAVGQEKFQLPLVRLTQKERESITAVLFTPLPDFGPNNY